LRFGRFKEMLIDDLSSGSMPDLYTAVGGECGAVDLQQPEISGFYRKSGVVGPTKREVTICTPKHLKPKCLRLGSEAEECWLFHA